MIGTAEGTALRDDQRQHDTGRDPDRLPGQMEHNRQPGDDDGKRKSNRLAPQAPAETPKGAAAPPASCAWLGCQ